MRPLKIFLDLDGTLLDHDAAERSAAIEFLAAFHSHLPQCSPDDFADLWQSIAQKHLNSYLDGQLSFVEQRRKRLQELFGAAGVTIDDATADEFFAVYLRRYERNWRLFPDVIETLDRLQGHSLGIISNGDREQQSSKLDSLGVRDRFDPVVISGEIGVAKPDAAIFHEACRRANCLPHECVYVGDRLDSDALASKHAGFHGVWLDRAGSGLGGDEVEFITSLVELPEIVDRIEKNQVSGAPHRARRGRLAPRCSHGPIEANAIWKE